MKLYLVRHGIADDRDDPKCPPDPKRRLTPEGIAKTRKAARGLATLDPSPELLLSSPYLRALETARVFGPVVEEPKKTSIHLLSHTAFAGVATRRTSLVLTLKSLTDIRSPRVQKREQTSAHRWHIDIPLTKPADVDTQLTTWLRAAYQLASKRSTT